MKSRKHKMLNLFQHLFLFFIITPLFAQPVPGSYYDFIDATKDMPAGHDKTSLIIYRPDNIGVLNDIRCFLRLEDEEGNDVTYTACTATYEWMSTPDIIRNYKHTYPKTITFSTGQ